MSDLDTWLDQSHKQDGVVGVVVVDNFSGMSLGTRGEAIAADAPHIKVLTTTTPCTVRVREFNVHVRSENNDDMLVATYKDDDEDRVVAMGY